MTIVLYRVERADSEVLGFPVPLREALKQVERLAPREREGALRVLRCEYDLNPEQPPTDSTAEQRKVWQATVLRFPDIGTLGTYVCKPSSQHRFGNAGDWSAPKGTTETSAIILYLWGVFDWQVRQGRAFEDSNGRGGLPISEVIFRDVIATRAQSWTRRDYTGVLHASHVHDSAYPLIDTDRPCGAV